MKSKSSLRQYYLRLSWHAAISISVLSLNKGIKGRNFQCTSSLCDLMSLIILNVIFICTSWDQSFLRGLMHVTLKMQCNATKALRIFFLFQLSFQMYDWSLQLPSVGSDLKSKLKRIFWVQLQSCNCSPKGSIQSADHTQYSYDSSSIFCSHESLGTRHWCTYGRHLTFNSCSPSLLSDAPCGQILRFTFDPGTHTHTHTHTLLGKNIFDGKKGSPNYTFILPLPWKTSTPPPPQ